MMMRSMRLAGVAPALLLAFGAAGLSACETVIHGDPPSPVQARGETARVAGSGDAADDPAIWVASDPAQSLILGTDKTEGLYVFGLDGEIRQFLPLGRFNNVDLRDGFPWGGEERVLVAATDRTNIALALFLLDPETGEVIPAPGGLLPLDVEDPYGVCLYKAPDGRFMAHANSTDGAYRQFVVREVAGSIEAEEIRRGALASQTEGCVFDDRTGKLYIGEEGAGIWRMPADPANGSEPVLVHPIDNAALVADVEGLSIYAQGEDGGYLIASSQGDSAYAVFALPEERYVGRFAVADGDVDGTSETDGLDASSRPLPGYPRGLVVIQDDADDQGGQNYKLVDWADVAAALE
jgi:3-phytase